MDTRKDVILADLKDTHNPLMPTQTTEEGHISPLSLAESKRVLRKIDMCIIPVMGFCYMLQYVDKLTLSYSTLLGLLKDLARKSLRRIDSWAVTASDRIPILLVLGGLLLRLPGLELAQFISHCPTSFGEIPGSHSVSDPCSTFIVPALCAHLTSAPINTTARQHIDQVNSFIWGGILMCHGACQGFASLMAARFFLGVAEAALAPGFALITGMFYTRKEQPIRQGAWWLGNAVANVIGGVVAHGIGQITTSPLQHWRLLFLILGAVTSAYAFVLYLVLPDSPTKAIFLDERQRQVALQRTIHNKTGLMDNDTFVTSQVMDALRDPQIWLLVLYTVSVNLANGGLTSRYLKALLIQMPVGAAQLVFLLLTSGLASIIPSSRLVLMIFNTISSMVGMIMVYELKGRAGRMGGLCLAAVFACNIPLSLSLISSNVGGFTKRSVASATLFVAYCVGNIIGPQFFLASQKPRYTTGLRASLSGLALGAAFLICLLVYYISENRRRNRLYGASPPLSLDEELREDLSGKTDRELTDFRYVI